MSMKGTVLRRRLGAWGMRVGVSVMRGMVVSLRVLRAEERPFGHAAKRGVVKSLLRGEGHWAVDPGGEAGAELVGAPVADEEAGELEGVEGGLELAGEVGAGEVEAGVVDGGDGVHGVVA